MGITVSSQAQNMYNAYTLSNSDTYKENEIDSSTVSKEKYNVSNLTNALDTLEKTDSVGFASVGNVVAYAKNAYKKSQLEKYDELSDKETVSISDLISGSTGANDIYNLLEDKNALSSDKIKNLMDTDTSAGSKYSAYLNDSGNVINTLA